MTGFDLSSFWPGPPPDFPLLTPESSDEHDYYFRCADCRHLIAIGLWLAHGDLIECDTPRCLGQFYANLPR